MAVIVKEGQLAASFKRVNFIGFPTKSDKASDLSMLRLNKSGKFAGVVTERVNKLVIPLSESRQTRVKFKSLGDNVGLILPKAKVKDAFATLKIIKKHNGELEVKVACQVSESKSTENQKRANQILKKASLTINSNSSMQKIEGHDALENKNPKQTPYPKTFSGYYEKKTKSLDYRSAFTSPELCASKAPADKKTRTSEPSVKPNANSQKFGQPPAATKSAHHTPPKSNKKIAKQHATKLSDKAAQSNDAFSAKESRLTQLQIIRRHQCAQQFKQLETCFNEPLLPNSEYFSGKGLAPDHAGIVPRYELKRLAEQIQQRFSALSNQVNTILGNKNQAPEAKALALRFLIIQAIEYGYILPESRVELPALSTPNTDNKASALYSLSEICQAHSDFLNGAAKAHSTDGTPSIALNRLEAAEQRWLSKLKAETGVSLDLNFKVYTLSKLGVCQPLGTQLGWLSTSLVNHMTDYICKTLGANEEELRRLTTETPKQQQASVRLQHFFESCYSKDIKKWPTKLRRNQYSTTPNNCYQLTQAIKNKAQEILGRLPFTNTSRYNTSGKNPSAATGELLFFLTKPEMVYLLLQNALESGTSALLEDPKQCHLSRLLNILPKQETVAPYALTAPSSELVPPNPILDKLLARYSLPIPSRHREHAKIALWNIIENQTPIINLGRPVQNMVSSDRQLQNENSATLSQADTPCLSHYPDIESAHHSRVFGALSATGQTLPKTPLHANYVSTHWGDFIASQQPPKTSDGQKQWWSMVAQEKVGLIVDLRSYDDIAKYSRNQADLANRVNKNQRLGSSYDQTEGLNYIAPFGRKFQAGKPGNKPHASTMGNISLQTDDTQERLVGADLIQTQHAVHLTGDRPNNHRVERLHFLGWPDKTALTPQSLLDLARVIRERQARLYAAQDSVAAPNALPGQSPNRVKTLIHCKAGVGRTGTVATLLDVMTAIDNTPPANINGHWLANTLVQSVLRGRHDRSDLYVQNQTQFDSLFDAAFMYAAERKNKQGQTK